MKQTHDIPEVVTVQTSKHQVCHYGSIGHASRVYFQDDGPSVACWLVYLKPATWRCSLKYSACPLAEAEGIISQSFAPLDHIYFLCFGPQTTPTVVVDIFEFRRPADFFSVVFRPHPNRKFDAD